MIAIVWLVLLIPLIVWHENSSIQNETLDLIVRWFLFFFYLAPVWGLIWVLIKLFN